MKFSLTTVLFLAILSQTSISHVRGTLTLVQAKNSVFTMTPYDPRRIGYESLPVVVVGAGGGRLGPREKLKIFASILKNQTPSEVRSVKFSFYVFRFDNLNEPIEMGQTPLIPVELSPSEQSRVNLHITNVDEISSLAYQEGAKFHLELVVSEVHFKNGVIWQGTGLPGKIKRKAEKVLNPDKCS